jgi:2-methylfumaryl-CoA isomerase
MVVAISPGQWQALSNATGLEAPLAALERSLGVNFLKEEDRYRARHEIAALLEPWFRTQSFDQLRKELDNAGVCWGAFQTFTQLLEEDLRVSTESPVFADVEHPGIGVLRTPSSPMLMPTSPPVPPAPAPLLGAHTDEVLAELLSLTGAEIGKLHDDGLVAGPSMHLHGSQ